MEWGGELVFTIGENLAVILLPAFRRRTPTATMFQPLPSHQHPALIWVVNDFGWPQPLSGFFVSERVNR